MKEKTLATKGFNPRTHTGCDRNACHSHAKAQRFNPRTHTGCDSSSVSSLPFGWMFQSTHPHGVRLYTASQDNTKSMFQSTHPHGVRPRQGHVFASLAVSIHAPTRGATLFRYEKLLRAEFQSTHPHGVRPKCLSFTRQGSAFQSTHPHGVRHSMSFHSLRCKTVSIHAPTRGATNISFM